jgi:hypothetical protein
VTIISVILIVLGIVLFALFPTLVFLASLRPISKWVLSVSLVLFLFSVFLLDGVIVSNGNWEQATAVWNARILSSPLSANRNARFDNPVYQQFASPGKVRIMLPEGHRMISIEKRGEASVSVQRLDSFDIVVIQTQDPMSKISIGTDREQEYQISFDPEGPWLVRGRNIRYYIGEGL